MVLVRRNIAEYREILAAIIEFMFASGLGTKDVVATAKEAVQRAKVAGRGLKAEMPGGLALAALVLDAWHRERVYLTQSRRPRAIRLRGPAPSLEALIKSQSGRFRAALVLRGLVSHKLIVPCGNGLFKPTSDVALLS
jgi:hypothetical protein